MTTAAEEARAWRAKNLEKARASGRSYYDRNKDQIREKRRLKYQQNKTELAQIRASKRDLKRAQDLKRLYGITPEEYDRLLVRQEGRCAICGSEKPGARRHFHVDHDHRTGKVRGLLCRGCNVGIGSLKEDPDVLIRAVEYLKRAP